MQKDRAHERAKAWFARAVDERLVLHVPAVALAELAAAIARQTDRKRATRLAAEAVAVLVDSGTKVVDVSASLGSRAGQIAGTHRLRGCDAIYVALAELLGQPLVTLDVEQLERGAKIIETVEP
jgi:predicted nucleic acid-binding protein